MRPVSPEFLDRPRVHCPRLRSARAEVWSLGRIFVLQVRHGEGGLVLVGAFRAGLDLLVQTPKLEGKLRHRRPRFGPRCVQDSSAEFGESPQSPWTTTSTPLIHSPRSICGARAWSGPTPRQRSSFWWMSRARRPSSRSSSHSASNGLIAIEAAAASPFGAFLWGCAKSPCRLDCVLQIASCARAAYNRLRSPFRFGPRPQFQWLECVSLAAVSLGRL